MNLEWNDEMISAFRKIIAMDENFKNISNQIGFPENRSTMEGFRSCLLYTSPSPRDP